MKFTAFTLAVMTALSFANAQAQSTNQNIPVVQMQNATNCHVRTNGTHYSDMGVSYIGAFTESGYQYSTLTIGSWGAIPILNGNTVILDLDENADKFPESYQPGDQYIITDDSTNCYLVNGPIGCFKLSPVNPCV